MAYLRLVRPINLLLIAFTQISIRYGLFEYLNADISLSHLELVLLILATLCIAAGGNVINDIYDVDIDRINKPKKVIIDVSISSKSANRLYIFLTIIGVALGFYLSNSIGRPGFAAIFIIISALLYLYTSYLKSILIIGNLVVSILVGMSLILVGLFELFPAITVENQLSQSVIFRIILNYAFFAFFLNFIREIVKDLQDINGDQNGGLNTLPIALGRKRSTVIVFILGVLAVSTIVFYVYIYLYDSKWAVLYFLFLIVGPLLFFCIKSWSASTNEDYSFLSKLLKVTMMFGILSLLFKEFIPF